MNRTAISVKCVVTGKIDHLFAMSPREAADYRENASRYLSVEALDKGWRWLSSLSVRELTVFKTVKQFPDDTLMRELRYFKNPADELSIEMNDDLGKVFFA